MLRIPLLRLPLRGGGDFAEGIMKDTRAHELAHSVFHAKPEILKSEAGSQLTLFERYPLSGMVQRIFSSAAKPYQHTPNWVEEAFATHISADVFKGDVSEGSGILTSYAHFGDGAFFLPEHYLVYSSLFPGRPGTRVGAIAGYTLEMLNRRVPGTIEGMVGIARGTVDAKIYRSNLQKLVGKQLFGLMFNRHPYTDWTDIYRRVEGMRRTSETVLP